MFGRDSGRRVRRCVWLGVIVVGFAAGRAAAQDAGAMPAEILAAPSQACQSVPPYNIDAKALGEEQFSALLRRSATLRRQCARIAASHRLHVTLLLGASLQESHIGALTIIDRYEEGGIRASVTLRIAPDYMEMLAHEFEHILEQLEGVVLLDEVARGRAWQGWSGAFETRRAVDAGRRARHEGMAAQPVLVDARKSRD